MRRTEEKGEDWGSAFLKGSFGRILPRGKTDPFDLSCQELLQGRNSTLLWSEPTLFFHFQVKEGLSYWQHGISIVPSTFESWLRHVERQPVFVLYTREVFATTQEYWFLSLHDWLLTDRGQRYLVQTEPAPHFNVKRDFTKSDKQAANFHDVVVEEAQRAVRQELSPWATSEDWTLFPFDEAWFLRNMERAPLLEVPTSVLSSLRAAWPFSARKQLHQTLRGEVHSIPMASEWLASVRQLAGDVPSATSFQRQQFRRFVISVKAFEKRGVLLRLPPFRVGEVSCWRAFVAVYPRSLRMLQQFIIASPRPNDVMFAAALLPILALSEDGGVSGAAFQCLRSVATKVSPVSLYTDKSYRFQREMLRSLVESGYINDAAPLVDLVGKNGAPRLEATFLESYGWPTAALRGNLERKIGRPTRRDENLRPLYETMADLLLKRQWVHASPATRSLG